MSETLDGNRLLPAKSRSIAAKWKLSPQPSRNQAGTLNFGENKTECLLQLKVTDLIKVGKQHTAGRFLIQALSLSCGC